MTNIKLVPCAIAELIGEEIDKANINEIRTGGVFLTKSGRHIILNITDYGNGPELDFQEIVFPK